MPVAAESELRLGVSPALDEVRTLAGEHNLVPVRHTGGIIGLVKLPE